MLSLPPAVQLMACTVPVDMRKSFDALASEVEASLGHDPMSGHVYCFFGKRGRHLKLLWWDTDGWMMLAKRLEKGRFHPPWFGQAAVPTAWRLDAGDLAMVLQGIDTRGAKRLPRWRPSPENSG